MSYYRLKYNMDKYERSGVIAYHKELYGINKYDVIRGKEIKSWDERIAFSFKETEGKILTDYVWNNLGWLIVSEKFKNAIEFMKIDGIQYLPVNIINESSCEKLGNCYVVNICNFIKAVNMKQSEYIDLKGLYIFSSYTLNESQIGGLDIFRVEEDNIAIFVSEKFKKVIKDYKLTGFRFEKIKVV